MRFDTMLIYELIFGYDYLDDLYLLEIKAGCFYKTLLVWDKIKLQINKCWE